MARLGGSAQCEIDAPLPAVWEIIEDVLSAPDWQGGIDTVTALEHDAQGRATLVETENDIKVRRVKTRVRFRYDGPTRLTWSQEKGDMKSVEGAWELEDIGGERTQATYRLEVDPGRVLGMLVRGPVETATRALFVNGRPEELKRRVESAR
jgi:carbon monoxide dehydrogenase subunit G